MEHAFVDEHDLIARYVGGRLSENEMRDFEAHFVDCPVCLERLAFEQDFRSGLIDATGASARARTREGRPARIGSTRVLAEAAVVTLAVGTTIAYVQVHRHLDAALVRTTVLERNYTQARARADALEAQVHAPPASLPSRIAVVELDSTRAAGRATYVPVTIAPSASLVIFSLALGNAGDYSRFAASIEGPDGTVLLRVSDLRQASSTSVALAVDASNLSSGDHTIVLEAAIRDRPSSVIARYSVHIIRG